MNSKLFAKPLVERRVLHIRTVVEEQFLASRDVTDSNKRVAVIQQGLRDGLGIIDPGHRMPCCGWSAGSADRYG